MCPSRSNRKQNGKIEIFDPQKSLSSNAQIVCKAF